MCKEIKERLTLLSRDIEDIFLKTQTEILEMNTIMSEKKNTLHGLMKQLHRRLVNLYTQ